jgi:hypothetical protein
MLTMRQEQVDAFRQHHLQKFEDEMVEHLQKFSPRHWRVMGEPDGRRVIRLGIERAEKYGFTNRGPVRFYIELMSMFGSYFDTDPQHPWASSVLSDPETVDQDIRAERLYAAMNKYLEQVVEPERQHLREAVRPLMEARFEDVVQPGTELESEILKVLHSACPARCEYVGEAVLERLVQHGFELAQNYGFESDKGKVLMVILTFVVGHGFPNDPLNGWIVRRLSSKRWPDPNKRVDELSSKSLLYLKHILAGREET